MTFLLIWQVFVYFILYVPSKQQKQKKKSSIK